MEQIYTIPVNEAFDKSRDNKECGCPFCTLYKKLQEDELSLILGASMMEPDVRIKTNEKGFCITHYNMMQKRKRMLGMGLILESHLTEVKKKLDGKTFLGNNKSVALSSLLKLQNDCYICERIEKNLSMMIATATYLFEVDYEFKKKFEEQPFFCLPHYRALMEYAKCKMPKKVFAEFYQIAHGIQDKYLESLSKDVSWFCKKFDYRFDKEPWYNSKDSVKRAVQFLDGCFGEEE